jgi:hypothetical protein
MGKLVYGGAGIEIDFDDRALLHLQIAVTNKLRLDESFMLSWHDDMSTGGGRSTVWVDRSIPLYFKFFGSKVPKINQLWVEELLTSANSGTGMIMGSEPKPPTDA